MSLLRRVAWPAASLFAVACQGEITDGLPERPAGEARRQENDQYAGRKHDPSPGGEPVLAPAPQTDTMPSDAGAADAEAPSEDSSPP